MMHQDSYLAEIQDIAADIKVGIPYLFEGNVGPKIDALEIYVDGLKLGQATFGEKGLATTPWELEYIFKNAGNRSLIMTAKSEGKVISNRFHTFMVAAKEKPKPPEPAKPAVKIVESKVRHTTQGDMELEGLVVHYTAGQQHPDASGAISMANDPGHAPYAYWVLASDGTIYKTHELTRWGYHCATRHHRTHLGIEIMCPGKLVKVGNDFYPWYNLDRTGNPKGPAWPQDKIRYFAGNELQTKGYYAKYTDEQEAALIGLIQYLKDDCKNFSLENVVGHDEILPDYKDDPGGSLSMNMTSFRAFLKKAII